MNKAFPALVVFITLVGAGTAGAVDWNWLTQYNTPNMHIGQLALHPYYSLNEIYDSNIYLVPADRPNGVVVGGGNRESWITTNDLGLETNLPWHDLHNLALGYGFESQIYTTQPDVNNAFNQSAHADYTYKGAYGTTVKAGDSYVNTTDPAFSQLTGRQRRWENVMDTSLDYQPTGGRLAGGLDATQTNDKYIRPDFAAELNRYEQLFGFNVGYMIEPKTKVYVAYHRDIIHYSVPEIGIDKDNRAHNVALGIDGQITPKVQGHLEGGVSDRLYDVAVSSGNSRVFITGTVAGDLTYNADKYTTVKLGLSRMMQESVDASNPLYFENLVSLDFSHRFPHKFTAGVQGAYELDDYPFDQEIDANGDMGRRRDYTYQSGAWVTYDIQKWISTGVAYSYRQRFSSIPDQFSFTEHLVTLHAGLKF